MLASRHAEEDACEWGLQWPVARYQLGVAHCQSRINSGTHSEQSKQRARVLLSRLHPPSVLLLPLPKGHSLTYLPHVAGSLMQLQFWPRPTVILTLDVLPICRILVFGFAFLPLLASRFSFCFFASCGNFCTFYCNAADNFVAC